LNRNSDLVLMRFIYALSCRFAIVLLGLAASLLSLEGGFMTARADSPHRTLIAFGDSLTAGYLLPADQTFPARLERALRAKGYDISVVNGGVSGDTTADGLARLDWTVPDGTAGVIIELGANDMLRGIDPAIPRRNLIAILERLKERKIPVFIAGMKAARNLGEAYTAAFDAIYPDLAQAYGAPLYPFFLDGVAAQPGLILEDGLHPNSEGVKEIVRRIQPMLESWIGSGL
jgi:acyl-CoA thioesterase-1